MKLKNYEKKGIIIFFVIALLLGTFVLTMFTCFYKIPTYHLITGVVFKEDLIEAMFTDEELKILHNNSYFYIDDKKFKYNIKEIVTKALVQNGKNYSIVYIECSLDKAKEKDIIEMVYRDEKVKLFKIFEVIWR